MLSIVCSIEQMRITCIIRAIDEVAASMRSGTAGGQPLADGNRFTEVTARLAGIWAMVAELDSALTTRLTAYAANTLLPGSQ